MTATFTRRRLVLASAAAPLLAACATPSAPPRGATEMPPIVFVPGNGDTAALWITTLWRFESNGWPTERLHAVNMPYPLARDDDTVAQPGRSSTAEHMAFLAAEVDRVRAATGAAKVALVGNSRGGYAIRNYIANGGGASRVSHAVLAGVPNHGVYADAARRPNNEFNGAGPFLTALNRAGGSSEVTRGVAWLTIRSDRNDKYAQPDGAAVGAPGQSTGVTFDGPALAGAENVVLAGVDHRETAFSARAFGETFRFIAGRPPTTIDVVPQRGRLLLDGIVSGLGLDNREGDFATNLPLVGATVEVYPLDPATGERRGGAVHTKTIGADGRWGPLVDDGSTRYEFVVAAPGYATTHVYRSPFLRSSAYVHLRPERMAAADRGAAAIAILTRPRGYFGVGRDQMSFDGASPPPGVPGGVPTVASSKLRLDDARARPIAGEFNGERIVGRVWPAAQNHVTLLELTS